MYGSNARAERLGSSTVSPGCAPALCIETLVIGENHAGCLWTVMPLCAHPSFSTTSMLSDPEGCNACALADEVSSAGVFCVLHAHMGARHRQET